MGAEKKFSAYTECIDEYGRPCVFRTISGKIRPIAITGVVLNALKDNLETVLKHFDRNSVETLIRALESRNYNIIDRSFLGEIVKFLLKNCSLEDYIKEYLEHLEVLRNILRNYYNDLKKRRIQSRVDAAMGAILKYQDILEIRVEARDLTISFLEKNDLMELLDKARENDKEALSIIAHIYESYKRIVFFRKMMNMLRQTLSKHLDKCAGERIHVVLKGSTARLEASPSSDIEIAVYSPDLRECALCKKWLDNSNPAPLEKMVELRKRIEKAAEETFKDTKFADIDFGDPLLHEFSTPALLKILYALGINILSGEDEKKELLRPEPTAAWIPSMLRDHTEDPGILEDIARDFVAVIKTTRDLIGNEERRRKIIELKVLSPRRKQYDKKIVEIHREVFEAVTKNLAHYKPNDDEVIETMNKLWPPLLQRTIERAAERAGEPRGIPKSTHRICSEIVAVKNHQEAASRALEHKDKKLRKYLELLRATRKPYYLAKLPDQEKYKVVRRLIKEAVKLRARVLKDEREAIEVAKEAIGEIAENAIKYP